MPDSPSRLVGDDRAVELDDLPPRLSGLLAAVDGRDFERTSPPTDLWDRIAAAVNDEQAHDADHGGPTGAGSVVEYAIDADDIVVTLGEGWSEFAADNEAPELVAAPTGRTLWSQIGDPQLRDLWRTAVDRVRANEVSVSVPFRCDGPSSRRWFEMNLSPLPDGGVHFRSTLTFEMARPRVPMLERSAPRDEAAAAVAVCSCCAEGLHGETWVPVEELLSSLRLLEHAPAPSVSYGICPRCSTSLSTQFAAVGATAGHD
jgi:hypothetical protein